MKFRILTSLLVSFLLVSCSAKWANQLAKHQSTLSKTASSNIPIEQKLDSLLISFAEMMHQSLDRLNPKTGVKYVQSYAETNQQSILVILDQLNQKAKDMEKAEKISLGLNLLTKPYAKDFKELLPRFQRKYAQYKFCLLYTSPSPRDS